MFQRKHKMLVAYMPIAKITEKCVGWQELLDFI